MRCLGCTFFLFVCLTAVASADYMPPLSKEKVAEITAAQEKIVKSNTARIDENAKDIRAYSARGDAQFFLGRFKEAVADYEQMVELNSKLGSSHWRRGIAYFYNKQYKLAAKQFEDYHSFDDVDRENGIWRFFSQAKAYGMKKAQAGLLKYKKDDREPFPSVYQLFAGKITPKKILAKIDAAEISKTEREKRLFYAHLYIGLNESLHDREKSAKAHLKKAVANTWGPTAGFGPTYMWHVGRVHLDTLNREEEPRPNRP